MGSVAVDFSPSCRCPTCGAGARSEPPAQLCACRQGEAAFVREDGSPACLRCALSSVLPRVRRLPAWGYRYGSCVVVGWAGREKNNATWWLRCDCGSTDRVRADVVAARKHLTCGAAECRARRGELRRRAAA